MTIEEMESAVGFTPGEHMVDWYETRGFRPFAIQILRKLSGQEREFLAVEIMRFAREFAEGPQS